MDRSAIEALLEQAAVCTDDMEEINIPAVIIPKSNEIKSLEHLLDTPALFRSRFKTRVFDDFVRYTKKNSDNKNTSDDSTTYIDTESMSARTIFDHGRPSYPKWGHHTASLALKKTPAYDDLLVNEEEPITQQGLIDFLSDWRLNTTFFDSQRNEIEFQTAINRIRRLTVKKDGQAESSLGNFIASRSSLESIEVASGSESIPACFMFTTAPYEGFQQIDSYCELRALTDGNSVLMKYRIEALDAITEKIANEFREKLMSELPDATIYLGTVEFQ